ncbi:hypothetical protein HRG_012806 [Hirsutella rhossiliensis]
MIWVLSPVLVTCPRALLLHVLPSVKLPLLTPLPLNLPEPSPLVLPVLLSPPPPPLPPRGPLPAHPLPARPKNQPPPAPGAIIVFSRLRLSPPQSRPLVLLALWAGCVGIRLL